MNILLTAFRIFKNPITTVRKVKGLKKIRDQYRNRRPLARYIQSGKRYFINYNTPGWPSTAFNRYVQHQLTRFEKEKTTTIHTLVFAITKKCGFQCEHCCEWLNLNKSEKLSREDLLQIVHRFHGLGIAQVQLSGGEPLNRLSDIYYLLDNSPKGIDFWLYTTGYSLTPNKAYLLKKHGLTGITISLDHCNEEKHNQFRGVNDAYKRALQSAEHANKAGLLICFSLCATREFISTENLMEYANLAQRYGVSFIQILEPKAVGHYQGKDVLLQPTHQQKLEEFTELLNYNPAYTIYPTVVYHDYNKRRFGCSGSGVDYVYADTDGDVHNCPFCQKKLFSALDNDLPELLQQMKTNGCSTISFCSSKQN
ncbi:MAG: radical SAM protein [Calditrichaeota bacterium]|nr:radical SAM protein [Calditrichota bacterium]